MEIVLYHAVFISIHGPIYQKVNLSICKLFLNLNKSFLFLKRQY